MNIFVLFFWVGCSNKTGEEPKEIVEGEFLIDADEDSYISAEDCDDSNANINPSADELCDGLDNNCNGQVDEGVTTEFFGDSDADGYGNIFIVIEACEVPSGYVTNGSDCDDTSKESFPSAEEICDGLDNDCDDEIDDGLMETYFSDSDGDGYGHQAVEACRLDNGLSILDGDCDDSNPQIHPAIVEICDEIDNNCNDAIDEGVTSLWYPDKDNDGFGDESDMVSACEAPETYIDRGEDCDDLEVFSNPLMMEICDEFDNDCDGDIDEAGALGEIVFFIDEDTDGFGDATQSTITCFQPEGFAENSDDCNDDDVTINPEGIEICDGFDNDCNDLIDEHTAVDQPIWYIDYDGDGFGGTTHSISKCAQPEGFVGNFDDCDDLANTIHPEASEVCDGFDNDCDDSIDTDDISLDESSKLTFYLDADGDGFGMNHIALSIKDCSMPEGYVLDLSDCNDDNNGINPDAEEVCDGVDNDCDDQIDQSDADLLQDTLLLVYADNDNDGFGNPEITDFLCSLEDGFTDNADDCNDNDPVSTNILIDFDCDGILNEDDLDSDGDGFCDSNNNDISSDLDCDGILNENDRDADGNGICDGQITFVDIDDDCDGILNEDDLDSDGDGVCDRNENYIEEDADCDGALSTVDCDDNDATNIPGISEDCPVQNCSELIDIGQDQNDVFWINPDGTPQQIFCEQEIDGGGWIQCAGWQSRLDNDNGTNAFYPRDMFVHTYNSRDIMDGVNDGYWSIDCAELFVEIGATELMFASTTGDYWAFGLPDNLSTINDFYQVDYLNAGTLSDAPPTNVRTNTSLTDIRVDFNGDCAYGTGSHQWHILAAPNHNCMANSSSGISYRFLSNSWDNCSGSNCNNYNNFVSCGEDIFGIDCEDQWTYLYIR